MIKKKIIEACLWIIPVCGILLKAVYFQYSSGISEMPFFSRMNNNMYISLFAAVILLVSLILLFFNRKRLHVLILADAAAGLLLLADTLYFRYFQNLMTVTVLNQIRLLGAVGGSIRSLFKPADSVFLADIPILCICIVFFRRRYEDAIPRIKPIFRICAALLLFVCGFWLETFTYARSSQGTFTYDNKYVANNLGIFYFHFYDIDRFVKENYIEVRMLKEAEKAEIMNYFAADQKAGAGSSGAVPVSSGASSTISTDTTPSGAMPSGYTYGGCRYKGSVDGKNLIIVQLESIQQFLVNAKCNGREITPNLNRFIRDSVYLNNFYSQTGAGNTSDAEFLVNTSLYPLGDSSAYFRFPGNTYDSIGSKLKEKNYLTMVFHANYPSFWNRQEMYHSLGFSQFLSSRDFIKDEYLGWGLSDKSFFRQSLDLSDVTGPVFSFMITLTSHHPFNFFKADEGFDAGSLNGTMAGDYIKAASYVDEAVGDLLYDLKKRGLYDNSVIILYGDHCAFPKDQYKALSERTGYEFSEYNWINFQRVPCFIRVPGMKEKGVNGTVCGQIDLLPTIANLFGFDAPFALGHDIFNNAKGHAVLRNSSVIADDFIYAAPEDRVYDRKGRPVDKSLYAAEIAKYQYELKISDLILKKDALKYLK